MADLAGTSLPIGDMGLLHQVMMAVGVFVAVVGLLPALIYGLCAFAVRPRRNLGPPRFCLWLGTGQFVVLALMAALTAVAARGPGLVLLALAVWAVVLVPLGMAIRPSHGCEDERWSLAGAAPVRSDPAVPVNPWWIRSTARAVPTVQSLHTGAPGGYDH